MVPDRTRRGDGKPIDPEEGIGDATRMLKSASEKLEMAEERTRDAKQEESAREDSSSSLVDRDQEAGRCEIPEQIGHARVP